MPLQPHKNNPHHVQSILKYFNLFLNVPYLTVQLHLIGIKIIQQKLIYQSIILLPLYVTLGGTDMEDIIFLEESSFLRSMVGQTFESCCRDCRLPNITLVHRRIKPNLSNKVQSSDRLDQTVANLFTNSTTPPRI